LEANHSFSLNWAHSLRYFAVGLASIPAGIVYVWADQVLGIHNDWLMVGCMAVALLCAHLVWRRMQPTMPVAAQPVYVVENITAHAEPVSPSSQELVLVFGRTVAAGSISVAAVLVVGFATPPIVPNPSMPPTIQRACASELNLAAS
jgi:hypothetical protein